MPKSVESFVGGGLVIDMPGTDIADYLQSMLELQWLPSDEELIHNMETHIDHHRL